MHLTLTDDRRHLPRRPIKGHAMAVFSTGPTTTKLARVELIDASWTGIGVKTTDPIELGTAVSLTPEDSMWPRQTGIVIRCEKLDNGAYHLGLATRRKQAVA
ncbi:MAG TPA: hypothetical protein VD997_16900 [Phycisphaerales bacterium]|nr:hypothetical protein [Phycisphaerales bacterium]